MAKHMVQYPLFSGLEIADCIDRVMKCDDFFPPNIKVC